MFCTYKGDKHLSIRRSQNQFNSLSEFPYHNLGFLLVEFTSFHLTVSHKHVSVALYLISHIVRLRLISCRQYKLPRVIFSPSTITTTIAGSASMDFPLHYSCSVCLRYFILYHILFFLNLIIFLVHQHYYYHLHQFLLMYLVSYLDF